MSPATAWDAIAAVKAKADVPRPNVADFVEDIKDDPADVTRDAWAEAMIEEGVERRLAMRCADRLFEMSRARDRATVAEAKSEQAGDMGWILKPSASDMLIQALSRARESRAPKLALGCMFFAMGRAPYPHDSMRDLAREQAVSVEAVSNEVGEYQTIFGLPRTQLQKSARAVKVYVASNGARVRTQGTP